MKMGLVTAILEQYDYEKMIDTVSEMGFSCVEVACWPSGKAERRYAGVSHIDVARVCEDDAYAKHILDYAADHHVEISALAFYPNTMDGDDTAEVDCTLTGAELKAVIADLDSACARLPERKG